MLGLLNESSHVSTPAGRRRTSGPLGVVSRSMGVTSGSDRGDDRPPIADDDMVFVPEVGQLRRQQLRQLEAFLRGPPDARVDLQNMPDLSGFSSQQLERLDSWLSSAEGLALRNLSSRTLAPLEGQPTSHRQAQDRASSSAARGTTAMWIVEDEVFASLASDAEAMLQQEKWAEHECPICCQAVVDDAFALPCARKGCMSMFHGNCIRPWLERQPSCPLCRAEFRHLVRRSVTRPTREQCPLLASWLEALATEEHLFRLGVRPMPHELEPLDAPPVEVVTQHRQVGRLRPMESPGLAFIRMVFMSDHAGGLLGQTRDQPRHNGNASSTSVFRTVPASASPSPPEARAELPIREANVPRVGTPSQSSLLQHAAEADDSTAANAMVAQWSRSRAAAQHRVERIDPAAGLPGHSRASAASASTASNTPSRHTGTQVARSFNTAARSSAQSFFSWLADPSSTAGARIPGRSSRIAQRSLEPTEASPALRSSGSLAALAESAVRGGRRPTTSGTFNES
mmetsp:Transcript_16478/g.37061  ORF Transcript_16478/g.37061 Transcript_16478/m.37061 type:complete len:513 (-) Transcript_16478:113-1651(-)